MTDTTDEVDWYDGGEYEDAKELIARRLAEINRLNDDAESECVRLRKEAIVAIAEAKTLLNECKAELEKARATIIQLDDDYECKLMIAQKENAKLRALCAARPARLQIWCKGASITWDEWDNLRGWVAKIDAAGRGEGV